MSHIIFNEIKLEHTKMKPRLKQKQRRKNKIKYEKEK